MKKLKNPSFVIFGKLKALIDNETYDAVHAWNVPSAFIMKNIKSNKKILSIHGIYSEQIELLYSRTTGKLAKVGESKAFSYSTKLTTDSKTVQQYYKEKFHVNFIHLPAPLDTKKFKDITKIEKNFNQIAYVGRDSNEKGIDILKKAESEINGNVVYCTDRSWEEAMHVIKSSSIVVVPSRMESLPTVVKEAFYLNVPVIGTNVGGIPELISHNETGVLVSPENPKEIANAVNELLSNPEKVNKLTTNGYNFVKKNLTWDVMLPKFIQFYENLLNN